MPTLDTILDAIVKREGPFGHHPADKGGATCYGVTIGTFQFLYPGKTVEDLKALTPEHAGAIYRDVYFIKPGIALLPDFLHAQMLDFAVNSGPGLAIKALQECLGIKADGICGPKTIAAATIATPGLNNRLAIWRVMMLSRIVRRDPSQLVFLSGWSSRALSFIEP